MGQVQFNNSYYYCYYAYPRSYDASGLPVFSLKQI